MCFQIWLKFLRKKYKNDFKIQGITLVENWVVHEFFSGFFEFSGLNGLNYWETLCCMVLDKTFEEQLRKGSWFNLFFCIYTVNHMLH